MSSDGITPPIGGATSQVQRYCCVPPGDSGVAVGEGLSAAPTSARSRLRFFFSSFRGDSVGDGEVTGIAVALWLGDASVRRISAFPG